MRITRAEFANCDGFKKGNVPVGCGEFTNRNGLRDSNVPKAEVRLFKLGWSYISKYIEPYTYKFIFSAI